MKPKTSRHFVEKYPWPAWRAQVNGFRGQTATPEKMALRIQHDLWYIQNGALWLDLKILVMTPLVLVHRNAY